MTNRERTRVAAYARCHDADGRILLCRIAPSVMAGEIWTLPGGGLAFGEPPEDAVLRELTEETGYTGEIEGLDGVSDRLFAESDAGGRLHAIRIVYRVRIVGGERRDEVDGSTDRCGWFAPDEAHGLHLGELARRAIDRAQTARTMAGADQGG
jgi:ADP-ribose pyrophosphatase YjhB (NUDIX family)